MGLAAPSFAAVMFVALAGLVPALAAVPPENVRASDRAGEPLGRVQSEVSLAVHGDTLVAVWNDSEGQWGTGTLSGYATSLDRGVTWTDGGSVPDGPLTDISGDPSVVALPDGTWLHAAIDLGNDDGVAVSRGRVMGSGVGWDPPLSHVTGGGELLDKPYLDVDPVTGVVYLAYVNWSQNRGELVASHDAGVSWSTPLEVVHSSRAQGYVPAAGNDGAVYVVWTERVGEPDGEIWVRRARDRGAAWDGPPVRVVSLTAGSEVAPRCYDRVRNPTFASIAVDRSQGPHRGTVIVTYTDGPAGGVDAMVARSVDDGVTWSTPMRLHRDLGTDTVEQLWPSVCIGPDGRITAAWLDRRHDDGTSGLTDVYLAQSVDGGARFGPDRRVTDRSVAWCGVPADFVPAFGDYLDAVADPRSVWVGWPDARDGDPDVYTARIDDVRAVTVDDGSTGRWTPVADALTLSGAPAAGSGAGLALALLASPELGADLLTLGDGALDLALTVGTGTDAITVTGALRLVEDATPPAMHLEVAASGSLPSGLDLSLVVTPGVDGALDLSGTATPPAEPSRVVSGTAWPGDGPTVRRRAGFGRVLEATTRWQPDPTGGWRLDVVTEGVPPTPLSVDVMSTPDPTSTSDQASTTSAPTPSSEVGGGTSAPAEAPSLRVTSGPRDAVAAVALSLAGPARVRVEVFAVGGRRHLAREVDVPAGEGHRIALDDPSRPLPIGVHLVRVTVPGRGRDRVLMRKLVRLRPTRGR